jgi:hypothetical protein
VDAAQSPGVFVSALGTLVRESGASGDSTPAGPPDRLWYVAFITAAIATSVAVFCAYGYAWWHDPWLTPRHTHYMNLWWGVGGTLSLVIGFLIPAGILLATSSKKFPRWCAMITVAEVMCLAAAYLCFGHG